MKTAIAVVLLLGAAAVLGLGLTSAPASAQPTRVVPAVVMRALPGNAAAMVAKTEVAGVIPAPAKADDELEQLKPAEPRPAVADAKPPAVKPAEAKPVEAKPAEPKPAVPTDPTKK